MTFDTFDLFRIFFQQIFNIIFDILYISESNLSDQYSNILIIMLMMNKPQPYIPSFFLSHEYVEENIDY